MDKFITSDEVVSTAATVIKGAEEDPYLRNIMKTWVWLGEQNLAHPASLVKTTEIGVSDLSSKKPSDFASTIDIALFDDDDMEYSFVFRGSKKRIHGSSDMNYFIDVYEDPSFFHLSSNGSNVCTIKLTYYALPLDEDGNMMIPSSHLEPLVLFCRYMAAVRNNEPAGNIAQLDGMWKIKAAGVRGDQKMPTPVHAREILNKWISMIPKVHKYYH